MFAKVGVKRIQLVDTIEVHIQVDAKRAADRVVNMMRPVFLVEQQQDTDERGIDAKVIEQVGQKLACPIASIAFDKDAARKSSRVLTGGVGYFCRARIRITGLITPIVQSLRQAMVLAGFV